MKFYVKLNCMVTDDESVFKSDLMNIENHTRIEPEEYIM